MPESLTLLRHFAAGLTNVAQRGDATEASFYPALQRLLEDFGRATDRPRLCVTTLPKKTDAGNPDFRVWDGSHSIVGYIEAKPLAADLDAVEKSDQLRRYRATFPNLLLTNFLEFRLYRNGQRVGAASLTAEPNLSRCPKVSPYAAKRVWELLDQFMAFAASRELTAPALAVELAKRTRFLRHILLELLRDPDTYHKELQGAYEAFKKFFISNLSEDEFADLYAQTVAYGLLAARTRAGEGFNRQTAFYSIPRSLGVLRDLFRYLSLADLPRQLEWIVDDIAALMGAADVAGILRRYYQEHEGSDPIVYFYELFLAQYNPSERERRGVYYTPEAVVDYIVRSLHHLLKTRFGETEGLASKNVTLLDPAAGTMTFAVRAAQEAVREFGATHGSGAREAFIREHVLRNFYAFELMVAPYTIGHMKMAFYLQELGYSLRDDERVQFYLTNTLDVAQLEQTQMPGIASIAEESQLAARVKKEQPILVILGNPPYSGHSANRGEWIRSLIEDYKHVDGQPLGEANPKWLQDDYVKFLRFAEWKISQSGRGVVGMITNHAYLDNPTFRGMRRHLMQTFDEIYVLDLHGNKKRKEVSPDGSPDENIFDIQQGVAVAFFVKTSRLPSEEAKVYHAERWGTRAHKYEWLRSNGFESTPWQKVNAGPPFYLFCPRDEAGEQRYISFPSVSDIFVKYSVGIATARDRLTIHFTPDELWETVQRFLRLDPEEARERFRLGDDARDWTVALARQDLEDTGPDRCRIARLLYRPFDIRYTYYTGRSRGFHCMPRPEVMNHMLTGPNLALITPRRVEQSGEWRHAFVTRELSDHVAVSLKTNDTHFPLYLYPSPGQQAQFEEWEPSPQTMVPNLNPKLRRVLRRAYGKAPSPEELFGYIYAVLYAPMYRKTYGEFLRRDFPRVPFPADAEIFREMSALGQRLVALHLLESDEPRLPAVRFEGVGDARVGERDEEKVRYDAERQRVYVNGTQYFEPVSPDVWDYHVGGYQVCKRWLTDRRGRVLSLDEVRTYSRMVAALARTIEIQGAIDTLYETVQRQPLPVSVSTSETSRRGAARRVGRVA